MIQTPNLLSLLSAYNIIVFMLVFTRVSGMFISAPFFSTLTMPQMVRIWFSAIVAFIFFPLITASKAFIVPHDFAQFLILLLCEFFVGYLIGFIANLIIEAVRMAGHMLSIQMSLSIAEALDPSTGAHTNIVSSLYIYLASLIFITSGAVNYLFYTMYSSFSAVPMGTFIMFDGNIVSNMVLLFGQLFKIAFGIALPIFAVLLVCDMLLGLMSKMMPQMNIYMVAIPVKIYIGLTLILLFLSATNTYLRTIIENYMNAIKHLFT